MNGMPRLPSREADKRIVEHVQQPAVPMVKVCTKCGASKELNAFHKRKRGSGGLQSQCRDCILEKQRSDEYRKKQADYRRDPANIEKRKNYESRPEVVARRKETTKSEARRAAAEAYSKSERAKELRKASSQKEERRRNSAVYEASPHRKAIRSAYNATPKARAIFDAYRRANLEKYRVYQQNRRALKLKVGGSFSPGLAIKLFSLQRGRCPCCRQPLGDDYHIDHIVPLALGGPNCDENAQLLRKSCNLKKRAKHPIDFMQSRGFLL